MFSLWGAIMGGVNLLMHGAGWMEGGLHAGFEKVILDAELLGMVEAFLDPVVVDDDTLAFSAMEEVGPGGHFFGAEHTQSPLPDRVPQADALGLAELRDVGGGRLAGGARARPTAIWKELLDAYEPPPIDAAIARGARRVRRAPQGRGRRPDRLLTVASTRHASVRSSRRLRRPNPWRVA